MNGTVTHNGTGQSTARAHGKAHGKGMGGETGQETGGAMTLRNTATGGPFICTTPFWC